jgi:large subunit ribosomal protein L23
MQMHEIVKRPLITEKNAALQVAGKYAFEVDKRANKMEIKQAVETGFKVNVTKVNVVTIPGKSKRVGRRMTMTASWKKAVVTLKPGDKIDLFESVQ